VTVTVKLQPLVLPAPSIATQFTVVVPFGKLLPDGGLQFTGGFGVQLSLAIAV
jgi:hypothetical protein